jgi:hypothetical protein
LEIPAPAGLSRSIIEEIKPHYFLPKSLENAMLHESSQKFLAKLGRYCPPSDGANNKVRRRYTLAKSMKPIIRTSLAILILISASACNVTSGSRIVVGNTRPAIAPESVKIYLRPPAKYEEIAIVNATSKNAFASDQSLTDSALFRMKKDAAKLGANGILLSGVGTQQIGSIGQSFGSATAYSTASANAYRYGNTVSAYGTGTTNVYGSSTTINTPLFQKVSSGMAIYVSRE